MESKVTFETHREGANSKIDGFALITTAQTMAYYHRNDEILHVKDSNTDSADNQRDEIQCMSESAKSILGERKFTEYITSNARSKKFCSIHVSSSPGENKDKTVVIEGRCNGNEVIRRLKAVWSAAIVPFL